MQILCLHAHKRERPRGLDKSRRSPTWKIFNFFLAIWGAFLLPIFFSCGGLFPTFFSLCGIFTTIWGPFRYFFPMLGVFFVIASGIVWLTPPTPTQISTVPMHMHNFVFICAGAPNRGGGLGGSQPPLNFGWGG